MIYLTRSDRISLLPLSMRLYNGLDRAGIHTIGDILDYSEKYDWSSIHALGTKSIEEIEGCMHVLKHSSDEYTLVTEQERNQMLTNASISELLQYIPIRELDLSVPAKNRLLGAGFLYLSQVVQLNQHELFSIQYMGKKHAQEILEYCLKLQDSTYVKQQVTEHIHIDLSSIVSQGVLAIERTDTWRQLIDELNTFWGKNEKYYLKALSDIKEKYPDVQGESIIYLLYDDVMIHSKAKDGILKNIEKNENGISKNTLFELIPSHMRNTTVFDGILCELENDQSISIIDDEIHRLYPSVIDCIDTLENEKGQAILLMRLEGKTLNEIGNTYDLSRERARQIIIAQLKAIKKKQRYRALPSHFVEDQYAYVFEEYNFSLDDFIKAFDEKPSTYHYLTLVGNKSQQEKKLLEQALSDENIPAALRKRIEPVAYEDYLLVDGTRIKKDRPILVQHYIKTHCRALTDYDAFVDDYGNWLAEVGLQDSNYEIERRTYENRLQGADYVLWNHRRRFRYYPISANDYTDLFACIDFDQYENTEISTLKLFRDHPDVMLDYDIRDEYELHNLLKKVWPKDDPRITFHRMPMIELGKANRDEQVLNLLLQYAPISAEELSRKYEELYGARAATVQGSFFQAFSEYFYNGMYTIDAENLPSEQFYRLKEILDRDIYMIADIKRIYHRVFPDENGEHINPYTLKTLGFHVYAGYVVKNTYSSAADYFHHLLTDEMIVDLQEIDKRFLALSAFSSELLELRHDRIIIEFSPKQYLNIRRLNAGGITKEMLDHYCACVHSWVEPHSFFTIASLQQEGFRHELDDLGFEEWFYASLLVEDKEHFSYQRIGGTKLFFAGNSNAVFPDFLSDLISRETKMEIYDLRDLLEDHYGIVLSKEKLIEIIRESDLYYDTIMETVYIDYDAYFEEV